MLNNYNQKGMSLILTLSMILLLGILIIGLSKLGSGTSNLNSFSLNSTKAEYAAQAGVKIGLQHALQKINASDADFFSVISTPGGISSPSRNITASSNITYKYIITAVDPSSTPRPTQIRIAATGTVSLAGGKSVTGQAYAFLRITTFNPANVLTGAKYSKDVDTSNHKLKSSSPWGNNPAQYTSSTSTQTKVTPPYKEDIAVTFNDPQSKKNDFSISFTGQCAVGANSGNSGYAILYGLSATGGTYADPNNLDGYMFQYDPGADKFFVKKLKERNIDNKGAGYAKLPQDNTYYEKYKLDKNGIAIMDLDKETPSRNNTISGYANELNHDINNDLYKDHKLDYHYAFQPNGGDNGTVWVNLGVSQSADSPRMSEKIEDFDWKAQHTITISILKAADNQVPTQVIYCDGVEILRFVDRTQSALESFNGTRSGLRLWNTDASFTYQLSSSVANYQWAPTNSPPPNL